MSKDRHIIALGGGGFSMTPDNPLLDRYIFALARKKNPLVCFVPTASGDAERYIGNFYKAMAAHHPQCRATHLPLFEQKGNRVEQIAAADVIYVGGGNTFNMLTLWKAWGVDVLLRKAYERGTVMAGISAGGNCWFEQFLTDSTGRLSLMPGLGWLKGAFTPHYDGEAARRPAYQALLQKAGLSGYACDNDAALHFVNEELHRAVVGRSLAKAFLIAGGRKSAMREKKLPVLKLGA